MPNSRPWQEFPTPENIGHSVARALTKKEAVFAFHSDPLLASLVSCLGLRFEIGRAGWDRLSSRLGIELPHDGTNPWQTQIIEHDNQIGIRMWMPDPARTEQNIELKPRNPDFSSFLHPLSLDESGQLSQLVIFPEQVAERFRLKRGLELVIVRDWALDGFLSEKASESSNYQLANEHEAKTRIAEMQVALMLNFQQAFFGTHDLADHLLGAHRAGIERNRELIREIDQAFQQVFVGFKRQPSQSPSVLVTAYLLGIILDDLAQPVWYESEVHRSLARRALRLLQSPGAARFSSAAPSPEFHALINAAREAAFHKNPAERGLLEARWLDFSSAV